MMQVGLYLLVHPFGLTVRLGVEGRTWISLYPQLFIQLSCKPRDELRSMVTDHLLQDSVVSDHPIEEYIGCSLGHEGR